MRMALWWIWYPHLLFCVTMATRFRLSTEAPRMHVLHLVIGETMEPSRTVYTVEDSRMRHAGRMAHCNSRTLSILAQQRSTGGPIDKNIAAVRCEVCRISKSKKIPHPPSDHPRSSTRLELLHVDLQGKHRAESYGQYQSLAMFTDDRSGTQWWGLIHPTYRPGGLSPSAGDRAGC